MIVIGGVELIDGYTLIVDVRLYARLYGISFSINTRVVIMHDALDWPITVILPPRKSTTKDRVIIKLCGQMIQLQLD